MKAFYNIFVRKTLCLYFQYLPSIRQILDAYKKDINVIIKKYFLKKEI